MILLCAALLCACAAGWAEAPVYIGSRPTEEEVPVYDGSDLTAEEVPVEDGGSPAEEQPSVPDEGDQPGEQPSVPDEGDQPGEQPSVPDGGGDQPGDEPPADGGGDQPGDEPSDPDDGDPTEEQPPVHDGTHRTEEWVHGQPFAVMTDSLETHTWITVFDLYCVDCGRVVEENVRREETPQPHAWSVTRREPTCTEEGLEKSVCTLCGAEKTEILPLLSHQYADVALLSGREAGPVEYAGQVIGAVITPSTCTEDGAGALLCLMCQAAEKSVMIPRQGHDWSEWEEQEIPEDQICLSDVTAKRSCQRCGEEETKLVSAAPGHQWTGVSFTEPTCTAPGRAVRQCAVCGREDVIESPAVGHCYMWMDVKKPNGDIESQYVCTICGDVAQMRTKSTSHMYYNNTITSFGPMMRDLVGGGVWNRVTPLNLEAEGMFTYPLIASNKYTVGTATVINEKGTQVISYKLNTDSITVHTETLVIYPSLEALRTGENAVAVEFGQPIEMKNYFGDDKFVLMAITLKADYDSDDLSIQDFREDQAVINAISQLID